MKLLHKDRLRELGGSGSGNFGHAGRPGERGGSGEGGGEKDVINGAADMLSQAFERQRSQKIRDGVSQGFAEKTDHLTIEHGIVIGADGKSITLIGDEGSIKIPKDVDVKDSHIIHNHPGEHFPGLSPGDVSVAIGRDMASITATGRAGIITIDRPSGGWPNLSPEDIKSAYAPEFSRVRDIINTSKLYKRDVSMVEVSKELKDSSIKVLNDLGLEVKYVRRI